MKNKSHHKCPICNTTNSPKHENYFSCSICKAFYMFPIKTKDYSNGYWDSYWKHYDPTNRGSGQIEIFKNMIKTNDSIFNNTTIEIGSGCGYFLEAMKHLNKSVIGIESNHMAIELCKHRYDIDIEYLDIEDPFTMVRIQGTKANTICLYNTLEFLRTPVQAIKYLKSFSPKYFHIVVYKQYSNPFGNMEFCSYEKKTVEKLSDNCGLDIKEYNENAVEITVKLS